MREINLLELAPKVIRDMGARVAGKAENRRLALQFGFEYFDGTRAQGYGGYKYDGRWVAVARRLVELYGLKPGHRVLDIGCAKGYLIKDLMDVLPGIEVWGLDISDYAIRHCIADAAGRIVRASCDRLPFADGSFELALAINTIHNLDPERCVEAVRELQRVSPRAGFIQVDAFRTPEERQLFEDWMLTAKTYLQPEKWLELYRRAGYTGDYYWTIFSFDPEWIVGGRTQG
ncbi:MAG: class I SAM-dependent methyltransferase [Alphaproteobacteria bacterium]